VGRNLQKNYLTAFRKAALIFVSHSNWGGHHHVEVHDENYWVTKFTMFGFVYSEDLTKKVRAQAYSEQNKGVAPNGGNWDAQHIWLTMKVFINPAVAALPQHAHLLAEPDCFRKRGNGQRFNRECGEVTTDSDPVVAAGAALESKLPTEFHALPITADQDDKWFQHVKSKVKQIEHVA